MKLGNRKLKGFSLVEFLVVIAVIALLASIMMPTLQKAKELATGAVCRTQLRSFGNAFAMYAAEEDKWVPHGYWNTSKGSYDSNWSKYLHAYLGLTRYNTQVGPWNCWVTSPGDSVFQCPARDYASGSCYGININLVGNIPGTPDNIRGLHRIFMEQNPSSCMRLGDSKNWHTGYGLLFSDRYFYYALGTHGGGENYLFCDGHISWVSSEWDEAYTHYGGLDWQWNSGDYRIWDHTE